MVRQRKVYPERKPGFMDRLRARKAPEPQAKVTRSEHTNPITGTHKSKITKETHPRGPGAVGHGGRGPMAKRTGPGHAGHAGPGAGGVHTQRRKPGLGDKISGGLLKMKGSAEHKPGKKAAGTRRMHGTDGRGSTRVY